MFDPEKVSRQSHPNWRFPAIECNTVWDMYRAAQVVLASDYDQLLELYNEIKWKYEGLCK
jgi:hypothetical protein